MLHHMLRAAAQRAFNVLDPYFQYVTMLLHGDGTNGAQNNTFVDSSTNNFSITRNGNTTQGTFSPYGSNWSNYFDGSGDYLSVADNAAFDFGSGNFTIEMWANFSASQEHIVASQWPGASNRAWVIAADVSASSILFAFTTNGTTQINVSSSFTFKVGTWYHLAVCRDSTNLRIFVNGALLTTYNISTNTIYNSSASVLVGAFESGSIPTNGYISNVRLVKGTAVYTSAFTPSITPLTAITNTSLLTCQSNRFIDNSTNAFAITVNGNTSVQRFSPFSPTSAYSTSVIGGSGYFDGSGDYLSTPSTGQFAPSGDFTISCWYYPTTTNTYQQVIGNFNGSASTVWIIEITSGTGIAFYTNGTTVRISGSSKLNLNAWNYLVLARSGSTITGYVNGVSVGTYSQSGIFGSSTQAISIGRGGSSTASGDFAVGYISDIKLIDGSAVTTVPTAPQTATSGTSLLLNYTNAGIFDNAMMNDLETVGNAQISTSVKKYGTGSMYFDGSGDRLYEPSNQNFNFGTGDFTIELWANPISQGGHGSGNNDCLVDFRPGSTGVYGTLYIFSSGTGVYWYVNGANRITGGAISNGSWTHIAVCRASGSTKLFLNGVQSGSTYTDTNNYLVAPIMIGEFNDGTGGGNFYGYIDDLRITKGVARYTTTFTPPTAAFPNN